MELRVLRYFVEMAKQESMTNAALKLEVSQPTLSKQISKLEEELGQKLFVRGNYKIKLTPEGEILFKRATDILEMADLTALEFASMKDFNGGDIQIGCAESYGFTILAKAAKQLQDQYPNVHFHLYSGNAEAVCSRLDKGLLDFALVIQNVDYSKYESLKLNFFETWGLVMRKDSPLATKESITVEDLLTIPLIMSRQSMLNEMPSWLSKCYKKLNVVATYNLIFNASILVKEGVGYVLGLNQLVNTSTESELCFRPISPAMSSHLRLLWRKDQRFSQAAILYLDQVRKLCEIK